MEQEKLNELLAAYFSGNINSEDKNILLTWVNEKEEHQMLFQSYQSVWNESKEFNPDVEAAWKKVAMATGISKEAQVISIKPQTSKLFLRIAASLILLAAIAASLYSYLGNAETIYVATNANETKEIVLPDSTHVWLNKNSSLAYESDFVQNTREIKLTGEAFFEVEKDKAHPFIIHTNESYTKVLGTSFNVNANDPEKVIVAVTTGKVEVGFDEQHQVHLTPGYTGIASSKDKSVISEETVSSNYLTWKTGELKFEDVQLSEVFDWIESNFGMQINVDPSVRDCHFTGTFTQPQLEDILNVLQLSNNITYQVKGNQIDLKGEGCK